jgi:hypothetical protein
MAMTQAEIDKQKKSVRLYVTVMSKGFQSEPFACCDYHIGQFGSVDMMKVRIADQSLIPCEDCELEAGESPFSSGKLFVE